MNRRAWEEGKVRRLAQVYTDLEALEEQIWQTPDATKRAPLEAEREQLQRHIDDLRSETFEQALGDHRYDEWKASREEKN